MIRLGAIGPPFSAAASLVFLVIGAVAILMKKARGMILRGNYFN